MSYTDYYGALDESRLRTNEGAQKFSNDEECKGNFVNNYLHGYGEYTWKESSTYKGNFYMNEREGYGHHTYPDGSFFHGLYKSNKRYGPGVQTYADGRQDVGIWEGPRLVRLCTKQRFITQLPILGTMRSRVRIIQPEEPPNRPLEILLEAGGQGLEEYVGFLCNPYVRQPKSLSADHAGLRAIHRKGKPFELGFKMMAWNNGDRLCNLQLHTFSNIHDQSTVPFQIQSVICNERRKFCRRGIHEKNCLDMLWASAAGDVCRVKELLNTDVDPDVTDGDGNTALILASAVWEPQVVTLLLDWAADVNVTNDEGFSPLLIALYRYFHLYKKVEKLQGLYTITKKASSVSEHNKQQTIWTGEPELTAVKSSTRISAPRGSIKPTSDQSRHRSSLLTASKSEAKIKVVTEPVRNTTTSTKVVDARLLKLYFYTPYGLIRGKNLEFSPKAFVPIPTYSAPQITTCQSKDSSSGPQSSSTFRFRSPSTSTDRPSRRLPEIEGPSHAMPTKSKSLSIHDATQKMITTVEVLLKRGANPNLLSGDVTPLTLAIRAGDTTIVDLLLKYGASPEQTLSEEEGSVAPIHLAASLSTTPQGPAIIMSLIQSGANLSRRMKPDFSYISTLPERKLEVMEWTKHKNFQLQGKQALHIVCAKDTQPGTHIEPEVKSGGKPEITPIKSAIILLKKKAHDDNPTVKFGLHSVSRSDSNARIVAHIGEQARSKSKTLRHKSIDSGMNKGLDSDGAGKTRKSRDVSLGRGEKKTVISDKKTQVAIEHTPVQGRVKKEEEKRMVQYRLMAVVKSLVKAGANVNDEVNGQNPLSLAILHGNDALLPVLLEAGADPNKKLTMGTGSAMGAALSTEGERDRKFLDRKKVVDVLMGMGKADLSQECRFTPHEGDIGTAIDLFHRRIQQEKMDGISKDYLKKDRKKLAVYLGSLSRNKFLGKITPLLKVLKDPNLTKNEREELVKELKESLFEKLGKSPNQAKDAIASMKFCFNCGQVLRGKITAECEICTMPFCSQDCKLAAMNRGHREKECPRIVDCQTIINPVAARRVRAKKDNRMYNPPKPILRRSVGYILTECRDMKVIITPSEGTLHAVPKKENYSIN